MARSKAGLADQQVRAASAQAIIENPVFIGAMTTLEERYIEQFRTSKPDDDVARKDAYLSLQLLAQLSELLIKVAAEGRLASRELERIAAQEKADAARKGSQ